MFSLLLMIAYIALLALQPLVDLVVSTWIALRARYDMAMHMRHALTSGFSVLNGHIESVRFVDPFQSTLYPRDGEEEVANLIFGQVRQSRLDS